MRTAILSIVFLLVCAASLYAGSMGTLGNVYSFESLLESYADTTVSWLFRLIGIAVSVFAVVKLTKKQQIRKRKRKSRIANPKVIASPKAKIDIDQSVGKSTHIHNYHIQTNQQNYATQGSLEATIKDGNLNLKFKDGLHVPEGGTFQIMGVAKFDDAIESMIVGETEVQIQFNKDRIVFLPQGAVATGKRS